MLTPSWSLRSMNFTAVNILMGIYPSFRLLLKKYSATGDSNHIIPCCRYSCLPPYALTLKNAFSQKRKRQAQFHFATFPQKKDGSKYQSWDEKGHFVICLYFTWVQMRGERLLNLHSCSLISPAANSKGFQLPLSWKCYIPYFHDDTNVWNLQKLLSPGDMDFSHSAAALGSASGGGPDEQEDERFCQQCWA